MSNAFVCIMGVGTVFVGLICLIFICYILSAVCRIFLKNAPQTPAAKANVPSQKSSNVANKSEIIAASCAAIAEELGEDARNIKVVSFKKA